WRDPVERLRLVSERLAELTPSFSGVKKSDKHDEANVIQCKCKLGDGHFTVAIKVLKSSGVAPSTPETLHELEAKHPHAPPLNLSSSPLGVDALCVHKDLVGLLLRQLGEYITSAPLTPLVKPCGGIRPIAVGTVWRRLVYKVASFSIGNSMNTYLQDFQFGVGVPGGCEVVLHSANRLVESKGNEVGLSMLLEDFSNAFNLVDMSVLLEESRVRCPSIAHWVEFCYARPARLYYGDSILWSCQGVQQEDPLGPLLFALALHPLIQTINSLCELTLHACYLDDGTIVGDTLMVAKALDIIKTKGPARGLFLNVDKTEIFWPVKDPRSRVKGVFPINISCLLNGVKNLGGLVSLDEGFCRDLALKMVSKTISLMKAVHKLHDPQCELLLLRNCDGASKKLFHRTYSHLDAGIATWTKYHVQAKELTSFSFRTCSPLSLLKAQVQFDQALHDSLKKVVTASGLGFGDWQWQLATLPIKLGGLGILSAGDIIQYAFLASCLQMNDLEVGVKFRHNLVRDILVDICSKIGIMVRKEAPMGFLSHDGKYLRPADLLLFNWLQGKDACLDMTGISPFAGTGANSWAPGVALHNAVEKKKRKYASICKENGYKFIPFAFFTFREFDTEALDTLSRIKAISITTQIMLRVVHLSFI
ncbi:putative reverse transcriptase domain-containing protein, partial [Tanacetum coccineum]